MKSIFKLIFLISILISISSSNEKILLSNGEWPPYLSQKLKHNGFASHIVKEAFRAVNVDVEYLFMPWKRSFISAKEGFFNNRVCHGSLVWIYTEQRAEHFLYSDEVIVDDQVLYYLKDKPIAWNKIEDLKGKTIGGTAHTAYLMFEDAQKKGILTIQRAGNYDILFDRLLANRIDAVPLDKNVGDFFLRTKLSKEKRDRIVSSNNILQKKVFHLILSKKVKDNKKYIKLFNKGLKIIKDNGKYDELLEDLNRGFYDKP